MLEPPIVSGRAKGGAAEEADPVVLHAGKQKKGGGASMCAVTIVSCSHAQNPLDYAAG